MNNLSLIVVLRRAALELGAMLGLACFMLGMLVGSVLMLAWMREWI